MVWYGLEFARVEGRTESLTDCIFLRAKKQKDNKKDSFASRLTSPPPPPIQSIHRIAGALTHVVGKGWFVTGVCVVLVGFFFCPKFNKETMMVTGCLVRWYYIRFAYGRP